MSNVDLNDLKNQILVEHNKIRVHPSSYIPLVESQMKLLKEKILYRPGEVPVETNEGEKAYIEAIAFLRKQHPVDPITFDGRVAKASQEHAEELGRMGLATHESSNGKTVPQRIEQYCEWEDICAESLDFGTKTGKDVIISLLVDDGQESRCHRENLFKKEVKHLGIGSAVHKEYEFVHVINYVGGVRELGKPFFDPKTYKYEFPKDIISPLDADEEQPMKKEEKAKKAKNAFQLTDEDAPDGTVGCKILKNVSLYEGRVRRTTKKTYTLENGKEHIVEVEDY